MMALWIDLEETDQIESARQAWLEAAHVRKRAYQIWKGSGKDPLYLVNYLDARDYEEEKYQVYARLSH